MGNYYHSNKFYQVVEKIDRQGRKKYVVRAANNKFDLLFGIWTNYTKENDTLDEAIEQIQSIDKFKLKSEKIVYKERCI